MQLLTPASDLVPALSLAGVSRAFGGLRAVEDVSFDLRVGEAVSLIGPNGAGKSTLIQLISGMERCDRGSVRLAGHPIETLAPEVIARSGLARSFQTSRVFANLSVFDSVAIGVHADILGLRGSRSPLGWIDEMVSAALGLPHWKRRIAQESERVEAVLALFGDRLLPRRQHKASSLSYANRRRLDIARALVADPQVLLLDEPTAGMNPSETAELADLLGLLRERRPSLTQLIVEHKLGFIRSVSSRTLVLVEGRLVVDATPDVALSDPQVVAAYVGNASQSGNAKVSA